MAANRHHTKRSTYLPVKQATDEIAFVIATVALFGAVTGIGAMLLWLSLTV